MTMPLGQGKQTLKMTRLSCRRFRSNEAAVAGRDRLQPREPVAAAGASAEDWQLAAYQPAATVKTGGRLIKHARHYWLLLADSHLRRRLFGQDHAAAGSHGVTQTPG